MMPAFVDSIGPRRIGIALHIIAAVFLCVAVWLMWTYVERWFGIVALERAQAAALAGKHGDMLSDGRDAAGWLPTNTAAQILAIDWTDAHAEPAIERLLQHIPHNERATVHAMQAVYQRTHGIKNPRTLDESDGQLLTAADRYAAGQLIDWPKITAPTHAVVQCYAAQLFFKAMWTTQNREAIQKAAGAIRLLMPQHPDYRYIALISDALAVTIGPDVVIRNAKPLSSDVGSQSLSAIIRKIVALAPERSDTLLPLIPSALRNATENATLLGDNEPLDSQVATALRRGADPQMVMAVLQRCLQEQNYDFARQLVVTLKEPHLAPWSLKVARAAGDLAVLQQLTVDAGYTPTIYALQKVSGALRFHLVSPAQIIPTAPLTVTIGSNTLPQSAITRIGSLVEIAVAEQRGQIVITCDGTTIYSGIIQ